MSSEKDLKKYYISGGEFGFSPERNKSIINKTIKEYEQMRKRKRNAYSEQIKERAEAGASYLMSGKGAKSGKPIEKYFGRKTLAYLRGEQIRDEIMLRESSLFSKLGKKGGEK